jgi:hypothetical protein
MTWIIKIIYQPDDRSKPELGIQQAFTDTMVERANFDVREAYFALMLKELDRKIEHENTRG